MALILKAQLDSRSNAIDNSLLQQQDSDPKMPEKAIYNRCLEEAVIDKALFDELSAAYNKRNKCIHRYLLSDIDYDYATELVFELDGVHATWVSYDRGAAVPRSPDIDEWLSLAYSQKSASFAAEREYRIVIISLLSYKRPLADPIAPSIIFVRLKRRLSYCDLLPNYPQR